MIELTREICTDLKSATSREWLETNGIGGYACSTVSGINTRRYHSLLTAATRPPLGRINTVAKLQETLIVDGQKFELSANRYNGAVDPHGYEFIESFRLDPFPVWTYTVDGLELERKVFMVNDSNTTVCRWRLLEESGSRNVTLEVRPLFSFVDYHHIQHEDPRFDKSFETIDGSVRIRPYAETPDIYFGHNASGVEATGDWYRNFELEVERERGFDFTGDLFQPFVARFDLAEAADLVISTEQISAVDAGRLQKTEIERRTSLVAQSKASDDLSKQLVLAADQFVVRRGNGHSIIAGYPWFSDWGRDTMISLPGLTLTTCRPDIAKEILLEFSHHISQGMLPNRFPDAGEEAEYNTVDATLWYFEAVRAYLEATENADFIRTEIYPKLEDIIAWHLKGTRYKIHVDTDGLLYAGEPEVQLTWMDAKVGDRVITPRTGKPVEIEALWYNALCIMSELAEQFGDGDESKRYSSMADLAKLSFNALFWNDSAKCLYDVIENGDRDGSIRPNQILAASLKNSMLDDDRARAVVDRVEAELLTPVGLRSLAPHDPQYIPYYVGSGAERDSAYHQGTVWAWLIGPFVDAYRRVHPKSESRIFEILAGFQKHLSEAGLGQISEIFDAEEPYTARGCFAQAWSVAEILRVSSTTTSQGSSGRQARASSIVSP
jgi:predicted glycogen debranching enzyme